MKNNIFKAYSAKLAGYLRKNGFKIIGKELNLKNPQYDVFLFEDTQELRYYVNKYCQKQ